MTVRVVLGSILVAATMMIVAFVILNEPARMTDFEAGYKGRSIEAGAALFSTSCVGCHGVQGQGIEGVAPALNAADLFNGARMKEIGWAGTTKDYVRAAIAGGRPRASATFANYPLRMPTWSQQYGGPLRPDQIENLVDFVMNWEASTSATTPAAVVDAVGTDVNTALPAGDAAAGDALFHGQGGGGKFPCSACHSLTAGQTLVGPSLAGIATRGATTVAGYSAEQYVHESVVQPDAHVVEGFNSGIMPQTFGAQMTKQELADIIAFLMTQK
ncbi:MAG: c-type cytochrome [Chloroflexota bacterium]